MTEAWWLALPDGSLRRLEQALVIGRSSTCDVMLSGRRVSRRQALLHLAGSRPELVKLGRGHVRVGGVEVEGAVALSDGDIIEFEGERLEIRAGPGESARPRWLVRIDGMHPVAVASPGLSIGGGEDDDVVHEAWSPGALVIHPVDTGVVVTRGDEDEGVSIRPGEARRVGPHQVAVLGLVGRSLEESTAVAARSGSTRARARLATVGAGGLLVVEGGTGTTSVFLPGLRFALLRSLVSAAGGPEGYSTVDALCEAIWPEDPGKDQSDLNVLLYRLRKDLLAAGLDPARLVERIRGTGAFRCVGHIELELEPEV